MGAYLRQTVYLNISILTFRVKLLYVILHYIISNNDILYGAPEAAKVCILIQIFCIKIQLFKVQILKNAGFRLW